MATLPIRKRRLVTLFWGVFGIPENAEPPKREFWAAGSGVIVDASQGLVLTNRYLLENADDITVVLADGWRMAAEKVGPTQRST